jgi:hypothetical protein
MVSYHWDARPVYLFAEAIIIRGIDSPSFLLVKSAAEMKEIATADLSPLKVGTW